MNRISEYDIRKGKIQTLRELGIVPFAQTWNQKNRISDVATIDFSSLRPIEEILT